MELLWLLAGPILLVVFYWAWSITSHYDKNRKIFSTVVVICYFTFLLNLTIPFIPIVLLSCLWTRKLLRFGIGLWREFLENPDGGLSDPNP